MVCGLTRVRQQKQSNPYMYTVYIHVLIILLVFLFLLFKYLDIKRDNHEIHFCENLSSRLACLYCPDIPRPVSILAFGLQKLEP